MAVVKCGNIAFHIGETRETVIQLKNNFGDFMSVFVRALGSSTTRFKTAKPSAEAISRPSGVMSRQVPDILPAAPRSNLKFLKSWGW